MVCYLCTIYYLRLVTYEILHIYMYIYIYVYKYTYQICSITDCISYMKYPTSQSTCLVIYQILHITYHISYIVYVQLILCGIYHLYTIYIYMSCIIDNISCIVYYTLHIKYNIFILHDMQCLS